MAYGIWAEVSGGITGHRASWMKDNGQVRLFETFKAADDAAKHCLAKTQGDPHRTANFSYIAKPYDSQEKH